MKNYICYTGLHWLWLTFIILFIDFYTKQIILNNFQLYESIPFIHYINFTYTKNSGSAFSFLADENGWQCWLFIFISIIICIILAFIMYYQNINNKLINIAYALIIGGTLGNLYDRLVYGAVIDFIDFYINTWHWPTFNIADIAICIGTILIILNDFINTNKNLNIF
ncbi:MAG: signal peptidase II [Arsenophonus endosymbiont of Ceratovacuna japonica]